MDTPIKLTAAEMLLLHKVAAGLIQVRGTQIHRLFSAASETGTPVTRQMQALAAYVDLADDGVYELTVQGRHEIKMQARAAASRPGGR